MKKVLENTLKTKKYLDKLPKIYLIGCWAKYGVFDFPFAGKYAFDKFRAKKKVPLVYQYDDHNGTDDHYYLRLITETTTGSICGWTFDKKEAYRIAEKKNEELKS